MAADEGIDDPGHVHEARQDVLTEGRVERGIGPRRAEDEQPQDCARTHLDLPLSNEPLSPTIVSN